MSARIKEALSLHPSHEPAITPLDLLCENPSYSLENILSKIARKTHLPYVPLSIYDVDILKGQLLDHDFCFSHLILPFGQMSRTTLVATSNPFAQKAMKEAETRIPGVIQWYLAKPPDISRQLKYLFQGIS